MKINNIEKKIGIHFKDSRLLETALTHRSYLNENREEDLENNERLEFLGDAVLELLISKELFKKYTNKPEGELTGIRAALVRTESLAEESRNLGVGEYLRMSKGEENSGGKDKDYLLANTYEALLGAIYLDQGLKGCELFVKNTVLKKVEHIVKNELYIDPKTKVQELIQAKYKVTPTYKTKSAKGPDHDKSFTVTLLIGKKKFAEGVGTSKQRAEEDAASNAIDILEKE